MLSHQKEVTDVRTLPSDSKSKGGETMNVVCMPSVDPKGALDALVIMMTNKLHISEDIKLLPKDLGNEITLLK